MPNKVGELRLQKKGNEKIEEDKQKKLKWIFQCYS